ncbi:Lysophospholipase, alpha-beta hydrolase superfamily [Rhizobium sp. NFR07]|uniref:alpha/beta hydrolase n=1 Tax=Rhizobium sp. NFR07 TaxID=1566262 RepID=UPI0008EB0477|nr:alpha/beta fold hydrolase [Rhizobium sp. NFR07]SFB65128.1 Lysophospholipase, alpha-beta hydrolase superfamily [Rhizobium sp. NFR07]
MANSGIPAFDKNRLKAGVETYLSETEGRIGDIRQGAAKQVVWFDPSSKVKTNFALVYIHGFSASAEEIRPLPDWIASYLGANLFFTRLSGHGVSGHAMGVVKMEDWLADFSEALAIGEELGHEVILIGTSTGASLATLALSEQGISHRVSAAIFISPNFGLNTLGASLLTMPFGLLLATMILGPTRRLEPISAANAANWTLEYPTRALLPMARLVKLSVNSPVERTKTPVLFLYSSLDRVVKPKETRALAARWGADHAIFDVGPTGDSFNHVIGGEIFSPTTTTNLLERILVWLQGLLNAK